MARIDAWTMEQDDLLAAEWGMWPDEHVATWVEHTVAECRARIRVPRIREKRKRERDQRYYLANREAIKQKQREYYAAHRDTIVRHQRDRYYRRKVEARTGDVRGWYPREQEAA